MELNLYRVVKDGIEYTHKLSDEDAKSSRYPGAELVEPKAAEPVKLTAAQKRAAAKAEKERLAAAQADAPASTDSAAGDDTDAATAAVSEDDEEATA